MAWITFRLITLSMSLGMISLATSLPIQAMNESQPMEVDDGQERAIAGGILAPQPLPGEAQKHVRFEEKAGAGPVAKAPLKLVPAWRPAPLKIDP